MKYLDDAILDLLKSSPNGKTSRELETSLKKIGINTYHGPISGCLSKMHREGQVFYLRAKDPNDGCQPYVHTCFRDRYKSDERVDKPRTSKWESIARVLYNVISNPDATDQDRKDAIALYDRYLYDSSR